VALSTGGAAPSEFATTSKRRHQAPIVPFVLINWMILYVPYADPISREDYRDRVDSLRQARIASVMTDQISVAT
jgi:hypothetical protein